MTEHANPIEWITTAEAAELTGYTTAARFRQLATKGIVTAQKRGRDWLLDKESVLACVEKMGRLGTAKHDQETGRGR